MEPTGNCRTPRLSKSLGANVSKPWSDNADYTLRGGVARQSEDRLPKRMMFSSLVGKGKGGGRWGQHWMGCHEKDLEAFGIDKEGWTAAAKEGEGIPWHQGVLRGAEKFMTSWHKIEEEKSCDRAIDRDKKEQQGNKETTTKPGGGGKGGEAERGTGDCC